MANHDKAKRESSKGGLQRWCRAIVEIADLVDKRYPIKGMDVWRPYGWRAMKRIDALTHAEMERTGHDEVHFPLLIPEDSWKRRTVLLLYSKQHVKPA